MLEFIFKNKEWLFSGVGVGIIILSYHVVSATILKVRERRRAEPADSRPPEAEESESTFQPPASNTTAPGSKKLRRDTSPRSPRKSQKQKPSRTTPQITKRHLLAFSALATVVLLLTAGLYLFFSRPRTTIDSIAIMRFVNTSGDPGIEYLSDGIPESIINNLSQMPNLRVMSRNSSFNYSGEDVEARTVGRDLNVQVVLTGRISKRSDGLTMSVEIVNAGDNSQIWGQQYNRKLADVLTVQEEISRDVSEKLRLRLTGVDRQQLAGHSTGSLKAFEYYMQGRAYAQRRTHEDLLRASHYFNQAIEVDPNYARAYAGLAEVYANLGARGYIAPLEGRRRAEDAARKAIALDENLAEAHEALGQTYITFAPYDFPLGDRELRLAIELSPSLAMAHFHLAGSFLRQGRLDESLDEHLKARQLDPLSSIIARAIGATYLFKRDYQRALEVLRQANALGPAFSTTWEVGVYVQNRLFDEALAGLEKAKGERPNDPILMYSTAVIYAAQGKESEALKIIKELERAPGAGTSQAHWIAKIYAALGEKELALEWLERGLAVGALGTFYKDEPVWDSIRSEPRFTDLLRGMGVPR